MAIRSYLIIYIVIFLLPFSVRGTHLKAGEIIIERLSPNDANFLIKVVLYSDPGSTILPGGGILDFGDGTAIHGIFSADNVENELLNNRTAKNTFAFNHSYRRDSILYTVSYIENNRNSGIANITNSVNVPFYIETTFLVEAPCEMNNTPVLLIPPLDYAVAGKLFIHNPGAYDKEGDSISYRFVVPRQGENLDVPGYFLPEGMFLDLMKGDIIWQVPNVAGEFNIAFEINEWRRRDDSVIFLSSTVRDMQIIAGDNPGQPPAIVAPEDTCLEAGEYIVGNFELSDPDKDQVKLELFSQVFLMTNSPARIDPDSIFYSEPPFTTEFSWQTVMSHVRPLPYNVFYRASEKDEIDFPHAVVGSWKIMITAPAPRKLMTSLLEDGQIRLSWDPYDYEAKEFRVWRRVSRYNLPGTTCNTGIPDYAGYEMISKTNGTSSGFIDKHHSGRFARGAKYCYRLSAVMPGCAESESQPSEETCIQIPVDAPVITNISVLDTDPYEGRVLIRWTSSFDMDTTFHNPSSFTYRLQRAQGFLGKENAVIISPAGYTDTTFIDTGIDTEGKTFNYTVYLFENETLIDSSDAASMIRLASDPVLDKIGIQWNAEVPWSNNTQQYPYHLVYRNRSKEFDPGTFSLIDSVNVNFNRFLYIDSAQSDGIPLEGEYCYYVVARGSYGNPRLPEPLINYSQIFCAFKKDTVPPCPPNLVIENGDSKDCQAYLANKPCDYNYFFNDLTITPGCETPDFIGYNIYFSTGTNGPFEFLGFTEHDTYRHDSLPSFAGCYKASVVDFSGNESGLSLIACNDNCPDIKLPNVFTPNNDDWNEFFTEYSDSRNRLNECQRFIKEVELTIYNRYGKEIFISTLTGFGDRFIHWNGQDMNGKKVPSGVYYFEARVAVDVLDTTEKFRSYKGWVHVLY